MLNVLFLIIALGFAYAIIKNRGTYKSVLWYILGLLLLNAHISPTDFLVDIGIHKILVYSLTAGVFFNLLMKRKKSMLFPFSFSLFIIFIGAFIVSFFDGRLSFISKFSYPFREFFENYFCIFLGYYSILEENDIKKMRKILIFGIIIISSYGLFNSITKSNPYYELVQNMYLSMDNSNAIAALVERNDRYRAASTFSRTFDFGYYSAILSLIFLYYTNTIKKSSFLNYIVMALCILSMILSNSRTVILALSAAFLIYYMTALSSKGKVRYFFLVFAVAVISNLIIPAVGEIFSNTFNTLLGNETEVQGSSIDMRQEQLAGALYYWSDSPIIGNGYGYILNELGWGDKKNLDEQMRGFESIIFQLLIEQGFIGVFTKFFLFISIMIYFIRNLITYRILSGLGLSILILFLIFIIGTGPLGAIPITMTLIGVIVKTIQIKKHQFRKYLSSIQT